MHIICYNVLDRVKQTISKYGLFNDEHVYVAFSGGKDSTLLCLVLKELGYKVTAITFDVGYNSDWNELKRNTINLGIESIIIDCNFSKLTQMKKKQIADCFNDVLRISKNPTGIETICTPCFNAKMIMLSTWAEHNNIKQIAFAHHGTDAIASMLKSYFYYCDCKLDHNPKFDYLRYMQLVKRRSSYLLNNVSSVQWDDFVCELKALINLNCIGTDEPPRKKLNCSNIEIIRPLFVIFESEIKDYFIENSFIFQHSECKVSGVRNMSFLTPREMIQSYFTDYLSVENQSKLLDIITGKLDEYGCFKYNVRNNRKNLLGDYKTTVSTEIKL